MADAQSMRQAESALADAMKDVCVSAKREAGYNATYFIQMLAESGPVETARRLVTSDEPSDGFTALWSRGRLELTVEAKILDPRFRVLFTEEELDRARHRLAEYGFTVPEQP